MHSIRRQLLVWLLALVIVGVGFAGWLIYRQALAEANELFDYQLEQIAAALRDGSDAALRDLARLAISAFGRGEGSGVLGVDVQRIRRALGLKGVR